MTHRVTIGSGTDDPSGPPCCVGDLYLNTTTQVMWRALLAPSGEAIWVIDLVGPLPAPDAQIGPMVGAAFVFLASAGSGPDDVPLVGPASPRGPGPFGIAIMSVDVIVATAGTGTMQLRSAAGGGGDALSGPIPGTATGRQRETVGGGLTSMGRFTPSDTLYLRRSDRTVAGIVVIHGIRLYL